MKAINEEAAGTIMRHDLDGPFQKQTDENALEHGADALTRLHLHIAESIRLDTEQVRIWQDHNRGLIRRARG